MLELWFNCIYFWAMFWMLSRSLTASIAVAAILQLGLGEQAAKAQAVPSACNPSRANGNCDYGDLPDTYLTLFGSNGPRYRFGGSASGGSGARLGSEWDSEIDGQPSPGATLDDTTLRDDEDGVTFGPTWVEVTWKVFELFGAADTYNLSAWFDVNDNGSFEHPGERRINDSMIFGTANTTVKKRYDLLFNPRDHASRFRLTYVDGINVTGATDITPSGEFINFITPTPGSIGLSVGEVEDYKDVPGPLPLLGVGAAFGFSRKLRKRIKGATQVASTID